MLNAQEEASAYAGKRACVCVGGWVAVMYLVRAGMCMVQHSPHRLQLRGTQLRALAIAQVVPQTIVQVESPAKSSAAGSIWAQSQ